MQSEATMVQSIEDARRRARPSAPVGSRIPPNSPDAERALLGAMLLSRGAVVEAVHECRAEDFYVPSHGHIFGAMVTLFNRDQPIDPVTVAEELRRAELLEAAGGESVLISLQAGTPAISNAERYARIIEEHAMLRRLIHVAGEIAEIGYSLPADVEAAIDEAEAKVFDIAKHRARSTVERLADLLGESMDRLEALSQRGETVTGLPTGFVALDECLSGLQDSNLVIVGARPAMGKTSFALGMATHAAVRTHTPVLVFSLEMSRVEITQRLLCAEAVVDADRMRKGKLIESDWKKIGEAVGRLGEAPIYIDDNPSVTVMDIRAKARRLAARVDLGLVVVDYLQLMAGRTTAENRQVEVSEISRGLKILARELQIPVVALSQLSRNLESRADKRPMLADLRESGSLEQDADVVLFIYRDEVYNSQPSGMGNAEVIVAKHRNGPVGKLELVFRPQYTRFDDVTRL